MAREAHRIAIDDDDDDDEDEDRIFSLKEKMKKNPRKLSRTAGNSSCCIFRVPNSLVEMNEKAYLPQTVSIGPYHHGKPKLRVIEEHKVVYLKSFLARSPTVVLDEILGKIEEMENRVRLCYSEAIEFETRELVDMMVLDGCFIIELFCRVAKFGPRDSDDPIINMAWIFPFLMRDLLQLENQLPFFVLQTLYDISFPLQVRNERNMPSLPKLALDFFGSIVQIPDRVIDFQTPKPKHLLGLLHSSFEPTCPQRKNPPTTRKKPPTTRKKPPTTRKKPPTTQIKSSLQLIQSAKKLDLAGIMFRRIWEPKSYLDINFRKGVLNMPLIRMDDITTSLILNSVAYEQCYCHCSNHNTSYTVFMGCLINTPSDVGLLSDPKIIENYLGTDDEVVRFFNNIRKDVALDIQNCYLSGVFDDISDHYRDNWQVQFASFKNTYFSSPWTFISAFAAAILLGLTVIQAFFAVYSYKKPPK